MSGLKLKAIITGHPAELAARWSRLSWTKVIRLRVSIVHHRNLTIRQPIAIISWT